MEDVLDLYREPYDPLRPVVCMDEMPVGLVADARQPLKVRPGSDAKQDYEYIRNGSASVFGALDLKAGSRLLRVEGRRTKIEFAHFLKAVVDELCPDATVVRLVLDNLTTHTKAALYDAFEPEEARRIARKLEFHYTPKHGSWLNAVELEFAAAKKQCLDTRTPDIEQLTNTLNDWQQQRNKDKVRVRWTFQTETARTKLKTVYPPIEA
jgi:transposase